MKVPFFMECILPTVSMLKSVTETECYLLVIKACILHDSQLLHKNFRATSIKQTEL